MESTSTAPSRRWEKRHWLVVAGLAGATAVAVGVVLKFDVHAILETVVTVLREAGPVVFFAAMALLPAVGFPLMAFTLAAGPVFGSTLGPVAVIGWSLAAVLANLLLTYWLADRAVRPLVHRLLTWLGFSLPAGTPGGAWQVTLIVRLTPGPPFWVQSYLLGLLRVPLAPYLVVSMLVMTGYIVAIVCGGAAIFQGNGRLALIAVGVLGISIAVRQLLRKRAAHRLAPVRGE